MIAGKNGGDGGRLTKRK